MLERGVAGEGELEGVWEEMSEEDAPGKKKVLKKMPARKKKERKKKAVEPELDAAQSELVSSLV